ncbi:Protein S-acyltransferase 11 [Bienertia sinuspersici]
MATELIARSPLLEESSNGLKHPSQQDVELQLSESLTTHEHHPSVEQDYEAICWGCGLRLILPSSAPIFKCGWCGAITKQNQCKREGKNLQWRRGGVWAAYPVLFSVGYLFGGFNCVVTFLLAVSTISMFSLAAFSDAGTPSPVVWGSYPEVRKDELQDYTFCQYCSNPKSPRAHHCSSCGKCVLDMDHHCPFIGNCVGAANHRYFIGFLIVAVISVAYVAIVSAYAVLHIVPSLGEGSLQEIHGNGSDIRLMGILKDIFVAFVTSAIFFSSRGLVLLYLFIASISVGVGLIVLLWQQLYFIYEGRTFLASLSSQVEAKRDCRNLYRFFGFPYFCSRYLRGFCSSEKIHRK